MKKNYFNEYVKTISFGLKDFEKVKNKYTLQLKKYSEEIESIYPLQWDDIEYHTKGNDYATMQIERVKTHKKLGKGYKKPLRALRSAINNITYSKHIELAKQALQCNDNHAKVLAVCLYLANYKAINCEMKKALLQCIR